MCVPEGPQVKSVARKIQMTSISQVSVREVRFIVGTAGSPAEGFIRPIGLEMITQKRQTGSL